MNAFYFATGDSQKDSGLEIEFMLEKVESLVISLPETKQDKYQKFPKF